MGEVVQTVKGANNKRIFVYSHFNEESLQLRLYSNGVLHEKRVYLAITIADIQQKISINSMDSWLNQVLLPDEEKIYPLYFEEIYLTQLYEKSFLVFILGTDETDMIDLRQIRELGQQILTSWTQRAITMVDQKKDKENTELLIQILEELIQLNTQDDTKEMSANADLLQQQLEHLTDELEDEVPEKRLFIQLPADTLPEKLAEVTRIIDTTDTQFESIEKSMGYQFVSKRDLHAITRKLDFLPYCYMEFQKMQDDAWLPALEKLQKYTEEVYLFLDSLNKLPSIPFNSRKIISKKELKKAAIYQQLATALEELLYTPDESVNETSDTAKESEQKVIDFEARLESALIQAEATEAVAEVTEAVEEVDEVNLTAAAQEK